MYKQPENELSVFIEDGVWIDVKADPDNGGFCNVGVSKAKTEKTAYKYAAKRLQKLADEALAKYESM